MEVKKRLYVIVFGLLVQCIEVYAPPKQHTVGAKSPQSKGKSATSKKLKELDDDALLDEFQKKQEAKVVTSVPKEVGAATPKKTVSQQQKINTNSILLFDAVESHNIDMVNYLLQSQFIDINFNNNPEKITPLIYAVNKGYADIVRILLDKGADVNLTTKDKQTALIVATDQENEEIVRMLLDANADPNIKTIDGVTALMVATETANADIVRMLLDKGADLTITSTFESTCLMLASYGKHEEIVRILLDKGADPNTQTTDGVTALMFAAQKQSPNIVGILLDKGADPNIQANDGGTALMFAIEQGNAEIVRMLLDKGADKDLLENSGITTLMIAAYGKHDEIVRILLDRNADPNLQASDGVTALMFAAEQGNAEIVRMLLDKKANPDLRDNKGSTAFIKAFEHGHREIIQILLDYHINIYLNVINVDESKDLSQESKDLSQESKDILKMIQQKMQEPFYQELKIVMDRKRQEQKVVEQIDLVVKEQENEFDQINSLQEHERQLLDKDFFDNIDRIELEALQKERNQQKKQDLAKKIEDRKQERKISVNRKQESFEQKLKQIKEEKRKQLESLKQDSIRNLNNLIDKVHSQGGFCTQEQQAEISRFFGMHAVFISDTIRLQCNSTQKILHTYDALIDIDHIVNMRPQFRKIPNQNKYKIVLSGGHFKSNLDALIEYKVIGASRIQKKSSGGQEYILINNFDTSPLIKTVFPESFTVTDIVNCLIHGTIQKQEKQKTLLGNELIIIIAKYQGVSFRIVLDVDIRHVLKVVSCYPIFT